MVIGEVRQPVEEVRGTGILRAWRQGTKNVKAGFSEVFRLVFHALMSKDRHCALSSPLNHRIIQWFVLEGT